MDQIVDQIEDQIVCKLNCLGLWIRQWIGLQIRYVANGCQIGGKDPPDYQLIHTLTD